MGLRRSWWMSFFGVPQGLPGRLGVRLMPRSSRPFHSQIAAELDLQPEDELVDVGCGSATLFVDHAGHVRYVAGLDASELQLELARRRLAERIAAGTAEIVQGDAAHLPWEDGRFSVATSINALKFVPDPIAALREMHRVLRPGGRMAVTMGEAGYAPEGVDRGRGRRLRPVAVDRCSRTAAGGGGRLRRCRRLGHAGVLEGAARPRREVGARGAWREGDPMRLAPSLHRLGEPIVGCYLLEEAGEVTIIDAGVPAYYGDLTAELAAMGRTIEDVRALVLTHGHDDHIGFAERLRAERGVPVSIHELDAALARGEVGNPSAGMGERRLRSLLHYMVWLTRHGGMRTTALTEVATFDPGTTLDVPGALRVIHTPGHTHGSVSFHAPGHDALFVGDALATDAVISRATRSAGLSLRCRSR